MAFVSGLGVSSVASPGEVQRSACPAVRGMFTRRSVAVKASSSAKARAPLTMVEEGQKVPSFELKDQTGETVSAADFVGKKPMVVFFYPKDDSPGCTKQACAFRDAHEDFVEMGAEVIGISADKDHNPFTGKHNLPYKLLSDPDNAARKAFGVPNVFGLLPGRVTYVVNKDGKVVKVFNSMTDFTGHVEESRRALRVATSG